MSNPRAHRPWAVPLGAALVIAAALPAPVWAFTVEEILSAPFPNHLVAAPQGGAFAWVQNDRGVRNIWVARPPTYVGRRVTSYANDDGRVIADLQFAPDGRHVVYVVGDDPNRAGEFPNPFAVPEGIPQSIWIVSVAAKDTPRRLAEGASPRVSPRGDIVAYIHKKAVYSLPIAGRGDPRLLFQSRGTPRSLRFSPNGAKLAFVSDRGDHRFVGVYDRESHRLQYLDPSVDHDESPVWAPDGTRLALLRIRRDPSLVPFTPRRTAEPWSIRVADLAAGKVRTLWTADRGSGSAFWPVTGPMAGEDQLLWAEGERLVFPWEKDGWTHLYSVSAAGGKATLLTPGHFEVEHVTLSPDGKEVIFSSNQDDPDRRHLWRVSVAGGQPAAVTAGRGIEWSPAIAAGGRAIAFLRSDARSPAHAVVQIGAATPRPLIRDWLPRDFPLDELVEPEAVQFPAEGVPRIHGQLFPARRGSPGKRRPAVIFLHGGSRRQMLLGWHYRDYYHNAYALNQLLAHRGFVVLSVNYRSGIGYGMEFREALGYGAQGASEFRDVLAARRYLAARGDIDPRRIGLWGGSYGGYLTALGLARSSNAFAAGVDLHGVHDWNVVIRNFLETYDPRERTRVARLAFQSSPMASIKTWRSPVLLIHGDDDRNVPFSETVQLAAALRRQKVEFEELVFADEVHSFLLHRNWLAACAAAADFLSRRLGQE